MTKAEEYQTKAAEALAQLAGATTEAERSRLRRAHSVYVKLSTHGAEAAARAERRPPPRIKPEKPAATKPGAPKSGASAFKV